MRHLIALAGLSAGLLSIATTAAHAQDNPTSDLRLFTAEDVFELEWADDPQISPDGKQAIYLRRFNDIQTDRTRAHVWIVNLDGSGHQPLLADEGSYRSARWSPDGSRIAFMRRVEGGTGLFVHYLDTGREALVGTFDKSPGSLTWAPDGKSLAFSMAVPGDGPNLVKAPKKPEGAKWADAPVVIDRARYRTNGAGFLELAYDHIFVIPAEGGTPRQLTSGDFNHDGTLSFTPDGSEILLSANRNADWEMQSREADIFAVNVKSGALRQVTSEPGVESNPQVSPDGKSVAFLKTSNAREPFVPTNVFVMAVDGSNPRNLTQGLDRRAGDAQWLSNSEIAYTFQNRGENHIGVVNRSGDRRTAVEGIGGTTVGRPYVSGSFDAGAGGALVFTKGSATRPADLFAAARRGETRLTELNEDVLSHRDLGDLREFTYASSLDGLEIQGWMITPPGYEEGKKYPLIIEIHGGPHLAYGPHFSAE
ncbi:MAG: S9 family peptidase, partial [Pseudomonadota bacterium]